MKSLVVYSSVHHGNTKKIAEAIGDTIEADLMKTDEMMDIPLEQYDLIGFGSGIYHGKHHAKLFQTVDKINIKGKDVFVFSTSGTGRIKYNNSLIDLLSSKGALVKNNFSCKGFDTIGILKWIGGIAKGHPDNNDIESSRNFAKSLLI